MKRWILIAALVLGVAWLVVALVGGGKEAQPEAERAVPAPRTLDPVDVVEYADMEALTYRVRTTSDVLPGGLSAAMAPALVVWGRSDMSPGGSITIRNINHGGNPVSGVTVLRTGVVRPDMVARAEFVIVPLSGTDAISHGQIRFVFEEGGAELLGGDPDTVGEPEQLTDLILSWEAWRAPGVDYSVLTGMDPTAYELSMRAYTGIQRFLEDSLMGRPWSVYPLQLPGGKEGLAELLRVSLALGDGAGRYDIALFLDRAAEQWAGAGPGEEREGGDALALWREIRADLEPGRTGGDDRIDMTGWTGYQSVLRSCATMALYEVNLAAMRLIEKGHPHEGMRPTHVPRFTEEPEWMTELADANVAGVFLRAPKALAYVIRNPAAIPGMIPGELDAAGLVVREDGKPVKYRYTIDGDTPWGPADQLLIR